MVDASSAPGLCSCGRGTTSTPSFALASWKRTFEKDRRAHDDIPGRSGKSSGPWFAVAEIVVRIIAIRGRRFLPTILCGPERRCGLSVAILAIIHPMKQGIKHKPVTEQA